MIKSERLYTPQGFVEAVTGNYYIINADTIAGLIESIEYLLKENGHDNLWDYSFTEVEHIVENNLNVVLVELTGDDSNGEWKTVYRWFEVPDGFGE